MKYIISESKLKELIKEQDSDFYKKIIFEYWDTFGPSINQDMFDLLGITFNKSSIKREDVRRWLREYLGEDNIKEIINNFLNRKEHRIINCGGYNFDFTIINKINYKIENDEYFFNIMVNDVDGTVILIMLDNSNLKIGDARKKDYGFEIEEEVKDCIYEYLVDNLEIKTGISFTIDEVKYESDTY